MIGVGFEPCRKRGGWRALVSRNRPLSLVSTVPALISCCVWIENDAFLEGGGEINGMFVYKQLYIFSAIKVISKTDPRLSLSSRHLLLGGFSASASPKP